MKLAFIYNPVAQKKPGTQFIAMAQKFIKTHGDVPPAEADVVVSVGGDGALLYALAHTSGKPIFPVIPDGTSSVGFAVNRLKKGESLIEAIESAQKIPLHALQWTGTMNDGSKQTAKSYSSIYIQSHSAQGSLMKVRGRFNGMARSIKLGGDGISFDTGLGSTGTSCNYHGAAVPANLPLMVVTSLGSYMPRGLPAIIANDKCHFDIKCLSTSGKRPLKVGIDGTMFVAEPGKYYTRMQVSLDKQPSATLLAKPSTFHPMKIWLS